MADEFRGMKKEEARKLAAALDVAGGALSIQGPLISGLLAKWDGDQGDLGKFPAESTWSQDQAKDIRRRIGILDSDPKAELMLIGLTGVLDTWQKVKDRKGEIGGYVEEFQELKKNVTAPLRLTKIASGIEASLQLYQRWKQGGNVKAAKAVLDLNKYFGVTGDRLKAKNIAYIQEILKLKRIEMLYEQPWKWQQVARTFITTKLRIPLPAKLLNQAPGLSTLDRISLPSWEAPPRPPSSAPARASPQRCPLSAGWRSVSRERISSAPGPTTTEKRSRETPKRLGKQQRNGPETLWTRARRS